MQNLMEELDVLSALDALTDEQSARKAELLREILGGMRAAENQEMIGFDAAVLEAPLTYTEEELTELLGEDFDASDNEAIDLLQEHLKRTERTGFEMESPLYVLGPDYKLTLWEEFANRDRLTESIPRACLASFINMDGRLNLQSFRLRIFMPADRTPIEDDDTLVQYNIPNIPDNIRDQMDMIHQGDTFRTDQALAGWQREQVWNYFRTYCDRRGRRALPVYSAVERRTATEGVNYVDIRVMPFGIASSILSMDGTDLAKGKFSYMNALFTTAAMWEGVADYRLVAHVALTPEEFDRLTRMLGIGPYLDKTASDEVIGDGYGLAFPIRYTAKVVQTHVAQLTGEVIEEDEARRRATLLNNKNNRDYQFRWAYLNEDREGALPDEEGRWEIAALAKGTLLPTDRVAARQKLNDFKKYADANYTAELDPWIETASLLESILENTQVEVVVLVRGDQIKLGKDAVPKACQNTNQLSFLVGTHLVGAEPTDNPTPWVNAEPLYVPTFQLTGHAKQHVSRDLLNAEIDGLPAPEMFAQNSESRNTPPSLQDGYHGVHATTAGRRAYAKPEAFTVSGSSQQIMFLNGDAVGDILRHVNAMIVKLGQKCYTPGGIASLIHDAASKDRKMLDERQGQIDHGANLETITINRESGDLLNTALRSSLIRLDRAAYGLVGTGAEIGPGHLEMPEPILRVLNRFVGHKAKSLLRTFGSMYYGYMNHTCESSLQRFVDLNQHWSPFLSQGVLFMPREVTRHLNADDDGDIIIGMAAEVAVAQERQYLEQNSKRRRFRTIERLALVTLVSRYPQVDAPILWAAPLSIPSPFRARTDEDEESFRSFIEIFKPTTPNLLRTDDIIICESKRLVKVQTEGVTEKITAKGITGKPTLVNMLDMCKRKASLNQTGIRTRDLERMRVIWDMIQRRIDKEPEQKWLVQQLADAKFRTAQIQDAIELELKALKKEVDASIRVPLAFPDEPLAELKPDGTIINAGMSFDSDVRDLIPLAYHTELRKVDRVLHGDPNRESAGTSIEGLAYHGFEGLGKETAVLNMVLRGLDGKPDISGGAGVLINAFRSVRTDLSPWVEDLTKQVNRAEITEDHKHEATRILHLLKLWSDTWKDILSDDSDIPLSDSERASLSTSRVSAELRRVLQHYGREASREGLLLALQADWQSRAAGGEGKQNVTASLALLGARIGEIFPLGAGVVHVEPKAVSLEVFTRHEDRSARRDLPGYIGLQIPVKVRYDKDTDKFILIHGEDKYALYVAGKQHDRRPTSDDHIMYIKTRRRTAFLYW